MPTPEQIVFLVGGRGQRLGELTATTPKPLLPVGETPFLDILIRNAARFGLRRVILLAGYLGDEVQQRYRDWGAALGLEIECVIEPEPAGTGGALRHAAHLLDETFFLCNGDSWFDFNLLDLPLLPADADWVAKLALRSVPDTGRYGVVDLAGTQIKAMRARGADGVAGVINGGVYVLQRAILERISTLPCSIEHDVFPRLAEEGKLYGKVYQGFFLDIGVPDDFARAQTAVPGHLRRPAVFLDRDGVINRDHGYVHKPEDFEWCDGVIAAIRQLNEGGYYVFVITNQGGVAHGYYQEDAVHRLHAWMQRELAAQGAHIDGFYYCPHHPGGKVAAYSIACDCRKPAPGMIRAALKAWPVDAAGSVMFGDKPSDVEAAEAAGIRGILWQGGNLDQAVARLHAVP